MILSQKGINRSRDERVQILQEGLAVDVHQRYKEVIPIERSEIRYFLCSRLIGFESKRNDFLVHNPLDNNDK